LERWKSNSNYDRLGMDQSFLEYLGVAVPMIEMPVAPGRNISALVEIAARIHLLRRRGSQMSTSLAEPLKGLEPTK